MGQIPDEVVLYEPVQADGAGEGACDQAGIREHIEQLRQAAREARAVGEFGPYASMMKQIAELSGFLKVIPEPTEQTSPEEDRRLVEEAARRLGMEYPHLKPGQAGDWDR